MRYKIASDLPGRLRVRLGRGAFTAEEGYGIADAIAAVEGVQKATTSTANGSVLAIYDPAAPECRATILAALDALDRLALPNGQASDEQRLREADDEFQRRLIVKIAAHYGRRLLLPQPVRLAFNLAQSTRFVAKGLRHLLHGDLSVEVLDATAIVASFARGAYDSAGSVMFLLGISNLLEDYTHKRSRLALQQSLFSTTDEVWLVQDDGQDVKVPASHVKAGDVVRLRTGCMVPVDGTVVDGDAAVNEASMTGESQLVLKDAGSTVFAGTIVEDGNIAVRVRSCGDDTRINRIVSMIDESEKLKAGVQSRAERLADAIVPYSFLAFFAILAITRNPTKAMSVLMVDYSCAIKLSTPVAVMSAMREAANLGMVVKGGRYLEVMAAADAIVFDKTGTLTTATPAVSQVITLGDMAEDEVLHLAACLEEHFPHSMARAVVAEATRRGIHHTEEHHADVEYIVAHGIVSGVDGKRVALGSWHFLFEDQGVPEPEGLRERIAQDAPGCSLIYLAVGNKAQGAICITDPVRLEAASTIRRLREAGFKHVVMLTGDAENAARAVAGQLGIDEYRSQVLPEDKAQVIQELRDDGHVLVMVGDGINDSPALATADVSIAMLDASDIARETADITLLHSSLDAILALRTLSERLMARIGRNYRFIVGFNTALIALGVAGMLAPSASALLHNTSTMLITASSATRLLNEGGECHEDA